MSENLSKLVAGMYSADAAQPSYVTYAAFCQSCVSLLLEAISIVSMGFLLLLSWFKPWKLRVDKFSGCMLVYLGANTIGNVLSLPYSIYRVLWWTPTLTNVGVLYDSYWLFWMGLPCLSYGRIAPIPVLFLTLERIVILKVTTFTFQLKKWLPWFAGAIFIVVFLLDFAFFLAELPLNLTVVDNCEFASCEMVKYRSLTQIFTNLTFGSVNLIACIVFLCMLKTSPIEINVNDRAVRLSIWMELFLDLLPTYTGFFFNLFTGKPWSNVIGEYVLTFVGFEMAICGVFYLHIFYKRGGNKKVLPNVPRFLQHSSSQKVNVVNLAQTNMADSRSPIIRMPSNPHQH